MNPLQLNISLPNPILIIEGNDIFAELISSNLIERGYLCQKITSGTDAFEWLAESPAAVVIVGHTLPDMSGSDFIKKMAELGLAPPTIMVAFSSDTDLIAAMTTSGADDFILNDATFLIRLPHVVARALQDHEKAQRLQTAEMALQQSVTRLARAQKIAHMGSWEWNLATGEIYWSDQLYRIFGLPVGEPANITMDWHQNLINPLDQATFKNALRNTAINGVPFNINYRIVSNKSGQVVVNCQGEAEFDEYGCVSLITGTTLDITARVNAESEIQQLINYDPLTGLPNRNLLQDRLRLAIAQAAREKQSIGILMLDLDRFKSINESLGHAAGDKLLQAVAQRLQACIRDSDTLARIGSDEYVAVLAGVPNEEGITTFAKKILAMISEPFYIDGHEIFTTCSIGIAMYPIDGDDGHTLLKHADQAMYQAKDIDRNNFQFFSREMNNMVLERMILENSMRKGLERGEFFLVYQPQVDTRTGNIFGMEALIRWHHPDLGLLPPDRFIGVAEENGFIIPLGEWVLRNACRQNKIWQDQGLPHVRVAVNLSAKQFGQYHLDEIVAGTLLDTGLAPEWLELELTESAVMKDAEKNIAILNKFKDMGISLAIDDFGTGYSSLSYLKNFPISRLKIDRFFIRDITTNTDDAAIAKIIIDIARSLNMNVIAEGVETKAQMQFLSFNNCVEMQGYYFSRPVRANEFAELLHNGLRL